MVEIENDAYISADLLDEDGHLKTTTSSLATSTTNGKGSQSNGLPASSTASEAEARSPSTAESETYYSQIRDDGSNGDEYSYAKVSFVFELEWSSYDRIWFPVDLINKKV
jgi:hypothetical protein